MKPYLVLLVIFLLILSVLLINSITTQASPFLHKPTPTSQEEDVIAIEQAILESISDQREHILALLVNEVNVIETQISQDNKWAVFYTEMIDPQTGEVLPSEPGLVISLRTDDGWRVSLPADPGWATLVERAPTDIVPESVKTAYLELDSLYALATPAAPIGNFLLPWEAGKTVYLSRSTAHDGESSSVCPAPTLNGTACPAKSGSSSTKRISRVRRS